MELRGGSHEKGFGVIAYRGKANKASFHYSVKTTERVYTMVKEWFESLNSHVEFVKKMRAERSAPTSLKIGDIIVNSWGYDQTNVDFYRVTRTTAHYVWLQEIGSQQTEKETGNSMAAYVVANPEVISNAPVERHGSSKEYVNFRHGSGSKWDGKEMYESWYA
jgi:hypothetical protein